MGDNIFNNCQNNPFSRTNYAVLAAELHNVFLASYLGKHTQS